MAAARCALLAAEAEAATARERADASAADAAEQRQLAGEQRRAAATAAAAHAAGLEDALARLGAKSDLHQVPLEHLPFMFSLVTQCMQSHDVQRRCLHARLTITGTTQRQVRHDGTETLYASA